MLIKKCTKLTDEKHVNLFKAKYNLPKDEADKNRECIFASRKEIPQCATGESFTPKPDVVVIVPILETPTGTKLVLVRQFRPVLGAVEYDLPAGKIDKDENPVDAAKRELKEETGLTVKKFRDISPPIFSSAGLTDESSIFYFVEADGEPSRDFQEENEDIHVELVNYFDAAALVADRNKRISAKCWLILRMFGIMGRITSL